MARGAAHTYRPTIAQLRHAAPTSSFRRPYPAARTVRAANLYLIKRAPRRQAIEGRARHTTGDGAAAAATQVFRLIMRERAAQ